MNVVLLSLFSSQLHPQLGSTTKEYHLEKEHGVETHHDQHEQPGGELLYRIIQGRDVYRVIFRGVATVAAAARSVCGVAIDEGEEGNYETRNEKGLKTSIDDQCR